MRQETHQLLQNQHLGGLTLLMVRLLNKKINPVWLIFALFGLGIIGNALGFLS